MVAAEDHGDHGNLPRGSSCRPDSGAGPAEASCKIFIPKHKALSQWDFTVLAPGRSSPAGGHRALARGLQPWARKDPAAGIESR